MFNNIVIPSTKTSDSAVEPYNSMLAMQFLIENSNFTVCLDNHALYSLSSWN